jgi:ABC-type multidrug transport system fused ATPase/permease subunit
MTTLTRRSVVHIISQTKEYYPIIIIYSIIISILTLAAPISVQSLVNTFSFGPYFQPIFILSILLLVLLIVVGVLKSLQFLMVEYLQRKVYAQVAANVTNSFLKKDRPDFDKGKNLYLANRYFDVLIIQKSLAFLVTDGIAVVLQTFIGLILISFYHPFFIVLSILIIISIIAPIYTLGKDALSSSIKESTAKHKVAEFIERITSREMDGKDHTDQRSEVDSMIDEFLQTRSYHFKYLFRQNIMYMISFAFLNAILLGLGGYLVIKNELSVGQLVAAEVVVNAILYNFVSAAKYLETYYDLIAASEKVKIFYPSLNSSTMAKREDIEAEKLLYQSMSSIQSIHTPINYQNILKKFTAGFVLLTLLITFTPWQQTSLGEGRITALDPNDRAQFITATVGGRIDKWLVQDGDYVKKGDPIVNILDNDPDYLLRLETGRDAAIAKFEAAKEASDTARLNYRRQKKLVIEGLSSQKDLEKAKITYKKLLSGEASAASSLAKSEVSLSRQQLQVITAPRDGRILSVLHGSGSVNVKSGMPLVRFVPDAAQTIVELFIDGNDLPLVTPGREVRLQFEGWPAVQFSGWPSVAVGSFGGIVKVISPSVSANGQFRILVVPDTKEATPWPSSEYLRQGSRTIGLVLLNEVSIGYEIWRKINGFPKSSDAPVAEKLKKDYSKYTKGDSKKKDGDK